MEQLEVECARLQKLWQLAKMQNAHDQIAKRKEWRKAYEELWRRKNPDKFSKGRKAYEERNREKITGQKRAWVQANPESAVNARVRRAGDPHYKEQHRRLSKKRYASIPAEVRRKERHDRYWSDPVKHRAANNARVKRYRDNNPHAKIAAACRRRVYRAVKGIGRKSAKTVILLGCTFPELKLHIEQQFRNGMSWDNYGQWEIDHIRPCVSFDLSIADEQRACFHYSNLQPLRKAENRIKWSKTWHADPSVIRAT